VRVCPKGRKNQTGIVIILPAGGQGFGQRADDEEKRRRGEREKRRRGDKVKR
jgi:hypothetical protein